MILSWFLVSAALLLLVLVIYRLVEYFITRGKSSELEEWYEQCTDICAAVMEKSGFILKKAKIDEEYFELIFYVFASVIRVERITPVSYKLNEDDFDKFYSLTYLDYFIKRGRVKSNMVKLLVNVINATLISFWENDIDDRRLFYKLLRDLFLGLFGIREKDKKGEKGNFALYVFKVITAGRYEAILSKEVGEIFAKTRIN